MNEVVQSLSKLQLAAGNANASSLQPRPTPGPIIYDENGQPLGGLSLSSVERSIDTVDGMSGKYFTHVGDELQALKQIHDKWITVDSGASIPVIPKHCFHGYKIMPTAESMSGVCYTVANGQEVPDLGEVCLNIVTENGIVKNIRFRVADVDKPLLAVSACLLT